MTHAYNRQLFADQVRANPFAGSMTQEQWGGMASMLDYIDFLKWHPVDAATQYFHSWNAYCFATTFHETAFTMQPVTEYGSQTYLRGKSYYPYIGRGRVQLTWAANYERSDKEIVAGQWVADPGRFPGGKVDQLNDVVQALDDEVSNVNLFIGSWQGWYTGRKLTDYLTNAEKDYYNARRIINGTDKAAEIASYAEAFEAALRLAWQPDDVEMEEPDRPPPMPEPGVPEGPEPFAMPEHILEAFYQTGAAEIHMDDEYEGKKAVLVYRNPL